MIKFLDWFRPNLNTDEKCDDEQKQEEERRQTIRRSIRKSEERLEEQESFRKRAVSDNPITHRIRARPAREGG